MNRIVCSILAAGSAALAAASPAHAEPRYEQRNGAWVTVQGSWSVN